MKPPNFFLVGAPKCGTTALSEYLRHHPQIFMSEPKEPDFFADFKHPRYRMFDTLEEYLTIFEDANEDHIAVGEASVSYLGTPGALERVQAFAPDARIIVMLRNPIEAVQSMHSQRVFTMLEPEKDFERAWGLQEERAKGIGVPKRARDTRLYQYRELARFGTQTEHLLTVFPRDQVHLILFDDFKLDTKQVYEQMLAYLGVPSDGRTAFPRVNENKRHKREWLGRLLARPPRQIMRPVRAMKRVLGIQRFGVVSALQQFNADTSPRRALRPEFLDELRDTFRPEVEKIEQLTGRDLRHWLESTVLPVHTKPPKLATPAAPGVSRKRADAHPNTRPAQEHGTTAPRIPDRKGAPKRASGKTSGRR